MVKDMSWMRECPGPGRQMPCWRSKPTYRYPSPRLLSLTGCPCLSPGPVQPGGAGAEREGGRVAHVEGHILAHLRRLLSRTAKPILHSGPGGLVGPRAAGVKPCPLCRAIWKKATQQKMGSPVPDTPGDTASVPREPRAHHAWLAWLPTGAYHAGDRWTLLTWRASANLWDRTMWQTRTILGSPPPVRPGRVPTFTAAEPWRTCEK